MAVHRMKKPSSNVSAAPKRTLSLLFGLVWSLVLFLFGVMLLVAGVLGVVDTTLLLRARHWPVVDAHLDHCELILRSSKNNREYWDVFAAWSYGKGLQEHYQTYWQPADAPGYSSRQVSISDSERATITARYCGSPQINQLRVSPTHPAFARLNAAVVQQDWKASLIAGLFGLLGGTLLMAVAISLLRPNRTGSCFQRDCSR
jgi:hypothetical protein